MEKTVKYYPVKYTPEVFKELDAYLPTDAGRVNWYDLCVNHESESWQFDNIEEFYAEYRKDFRYASLRAHVYGTTQGVIGPGIIASVSISVTGGLAAVSNITVSARNRVEIERVMGLFEAHRIDCTIELAASDWQQTIKPVIFIGHGRSPQWRDLKDHLTDHHHFDVEAYETGARSGHAVRDILQEMLNRSSLALLVLTAEDEQSDGSRRPRENVVHETGLFQGSLGFSKAIVLVEEGVTPFSNLDGIQQIRFSAQNIRETFGDVLATIRREFPGSL